MQLKILILAFIMCGTLFASEVVELSGDKNYPPYSYEEKGVPKGIYVDILKAAFEQMPEYKLKLKMMAYQRAINMTKEGLTVGFFPPYYGVERTAWTKFSEPILGETTVVFAKEDTLKTKKRYPEDFYGTTLCLNRGFNQLLLGGEKLSKAIKENKIKLIEGDDNQACLSRVVRGMADFYINDQLIDTKKFPIIKKGMKAKENFGHVGFTLQDKNYPYMKDLQNRFNAIIQKMKDNGQIEEILKKYL